MLSGEGEERGDTEGDSGRYGLWLDPEGDPGHHHYQTCRDVGVEHVVTEIAQELGTRSIHRSLHLQSVQCSVVNHSLT